MDERELRTLIGEVKGGRLSRRRFVQTMVGLGLTGADGAPDARPPPAWPRRRPKPAYKPTKRGGGGPLKVLWWQGATLLNPHFANGTKDQDGSRIFYEPLAVWDTDGNLVPILAAEIPTRRRTAASPRAASRSRWKLKKGVTWHDGKPFTADDVRLHLGVRARPGHRRRDHRRLQGHHGRRRSTTTRSRSRFKKPTPFWADAFVGADGHDHPQAPVRAVQGREVARGADQPEAGRHRPLQVRRLQAGRHRPRRDQPELPRAEPALLRHDRDEGRRRRGLGGARGAADRRVRLRLEPAGRGRDPASAWSRAARASVDIVARRRHRAHPAATSPIPGPRSTASAPASRPSTRCCQRSGGARRRSALLVDREVGAGVHLRPHRRRHRQLPQQPAALPSPRTRSGSSTSTRRTRSSRRRAGRRAPTASAAKDGKKLKFVYQTSINAPRQKNQAIVKQAAARRPASTSSSSR